MFKLHRNTRRTFRTAALLSAAVLLAASSGVPAKADIIASWNGSVGLWDDVTAWSTNPVFPNNAGANLYDVVINAGDVGLNVNVAVQNLSLSTASLSGSRSVTVVNLLSLNDGAILTGAGTLTTKDVNFAALSAAITWSSGRLLISAGSASWTGGAGVVMGNGNDYTSQGTFTVNTTGNAAWAGGTFVNAGTFLKNSSDSTTLFTFNNTGTVTAASGALSFNGGGTHTGAFATTGSGLLAFSGLTHAFSSGSSITSANTVSFSAGSANLNSGSIYNVTGATTVSGATVTFAAGAVETALGSALNVSAGALTLNATGTPSVPTLNVSGGTLQGSQSLTVSSTFNWSGGTLAGGGTLTAANLAINLSANAALSGTRALVSTTTATWAASGAFNISAAGANVFTSQGSFAINTTAGGNWTGGTFNNSGALSKLSADANAITATFNNSGSVAMSAGTLSLGGGGSHTGAFSTTATGTLAFSGGTHNLNAGSSITGGNIAFTGGTTNLNTGSNYSAATTTVAGAIATFAAGSTLTSLGSALTVSAGTLNLNDGSAPSVTTLNLSGGTFQGSDSLNVSDTFNWTGNSNLNGGGTLTTKDLAINLTAGVSMAGTRTVVSTGSASWNSTGLFNINLSATNALTNKGTFTINTPSGGNFGGGTFNNQGTLTNASSDTKSFSGDFNNTGVFVVGAGSVQLNTVSQLVVATTATLTAGSWEIDDNATLLISGPPSNNITTNNANVTLSGPASLFARIDTLATNNGSFRLLAGRSFAATAFTNNGTLELGGGTFSATSLTNNAADILIGFGIVNVRPLNHGTIRAQGGELLFTNGIQGGSGTITISPGGTVNLSGGTSGTSAVALVHNGTTPGSLILGNNNLFLQVSYTNANFGTGNTFNKHANVSTTGGQIRADGDNTQILTGNVTGGATAAPFLSFGNLHVGDSLSKSYQINNPGTASGPNVLYALQNSTGGGNITDTRLTGTGITASNVGPVAYNGTSSLLSVLFTASADGSLTGQSLHIANTFDNIAEQTLSITGAAYNLATPLITGNPVNFGNHHIGDVVSPVTFSVKNNAPNDGFSETLDGTLSGPLGNLAFTGSGFTLLNPQSTDSSISATFDASTAGAKSGSVTLNLTSDGTGTSGLPNTSLTASTLTASGAIYRLATPLVTSNPVNFGNHHVGEVVTSSIAVQNNVPADGFSEKLDGALSAPTGTNLFSGNFNLFAAGSSSNVTATLDTSSAGSKSGSTLLTLTSDGAGTSGLPSTPRSTVTLTSSGSIFRLAAPALTGNPINLGNIHPGDLISPQFFSLQNNTPADGFSEKLDASITGASGNIIISGAVNLLAPGSTNAISLVATFPVGSFGHMTGSATLNLTSDGQAPGTPGNSGLGTTSLTPITLTASASLYRFAAPLVTSNPVTFGNHHVGDVVTAPIAVQNNVANDGFSEKLDGALSSPTGANTFSGNFTLLAPGSTSNLTATLDTASAGTKSGSAALTLTSNGTGTSGLPNTPVSTLTLSSSGTVFRLAQPITIANLNLGVLHVGASGVAHPVISNLAANDTFSENLAASFGAATGPILTAGSPISIAPGGTSSTLTLTLDTSSPGLAKSGSAVIHLNSDGTGTSGLGVTARPDQTVSLTADVLNFALAALQKSSGNGTFTVNDATHATLDFGVLNAGDAVSASLATLNAATGPADTLAGSWTFGTPLFSFSNFGPFTNLTAGGSLAGLLINFTASTPGFLSQTATLHPFSQNNAPFNGTLPDYTLTLKVAVNVLTALWNGGAGNWSDGTKWNINPQVPFNNTPTGAQYAVTVSTGTITLDVNPSVSSLTVSGGTLTGAAGSAITAPTLILQTGQLAVDSLNRGANTILSQSGGALNVNTLTQTAGSIALTGGTTQVGALTLTAGLFQVSGANLQITGSLSGAGTFNQSAGMTTLTAANSMTGPINLTGGTLQIGNGGATGSLGASILANAATLILNRTGTLIVPGTITGTGTLNKSAAGTATLANYQGTGALNVNAGTLAFATTAAPRHTPAVLLQASALAVAAGTTLDLSNHDMLIHNGNTPALESRIGAAYFFGLWNKPGITSSTAQTNPITSLGIMSGADYNIFSPTPGTFDGVPVANTDTIIKFTYAGDLNLDGLVNDDDLFIFNGAYFFTGTGNYAQGDLNFDGLVNDDDLFLFNGNYFFPPASPLATGPAMSSLTGSRRTAPVPEPASLFLLGLGTVGLFLQRKSRKLQRTSD